VSRDGSAPRSTASGATGHPVQSDRQPKSVGEIRSTYADLAGWFDRVDRLERLVTGPARARLFGDADGRVLDVACGTGTNYRYLPATSAYVGADLSRAMLDRAAARLPDGTPLLEMDAEHLGFADDSFDAVVSSLSTCTFPNPGSALREMARVCRPDGRIRLLEHGRSTASPVARLQAWYAPTHYAHVGCRLDQEPVEVVRRAGLDVESVRTGYLGVLTAMVVRPA
jgi:ubiquinone/menaquinone biosynthesis C-methylase UbiE